MSTIRVEVVVELVHVVGRVEFPAAAVAGEHDAQAGSLVGELLAAARAGDLGFRRPELDAGKSHCCSLNHVRAA